MADVAPPDISEPTTNLGSESVQEKGSASSVAQVEEEWKIQAEAFKSQGKIVNVKLIRLAVQREHCLPRAYTAYAALLNLVQSVLNAFRLRGQVGRHWYLTE